MQAYLLRVKLPRNNERYVKRIKEYILNECVERELECAVEFLDGRILVFSTPEILDVLKNIKNLRGIYLVSIFRDYGGLLERIKDMLHGRESFAVSSNNRSLAEEIGGDVTDELSIKVDLESPELRVTVERKGGYYLLYEENVYLNEQY